MLTLKKFYNCTKEEKELILSWRNHIDVRVHMVNTDPIQKKEHYDFIKTLINRDDLDYRLVINDNEYLGVIDLTNIKNDQAEFGLYKNPELDKGGIGFFLMQGVLLLSRQKRLKKLKLRVLKSNKKAINLYEKQAFIVTNEDSQYKYMERNMDSNIFIVAELSANHKHDINIAKESIKAIAQIGVDAVKIQTYTADTITIDCDNEYFQIEKGTMWDGRNLYNLYQEAYTPWEWHEELRNFAESLGLIFFSTPFDKTAIDFLVEKKNSL